MRQTYQPDVNFSSLEDVKEIVKNYEQTVFGRGEGISGNAQNLVRLNATRKAGPNSFRFRAVVNCISRIEALRDKEVSREHPETYENMMVAYAELCTACQKYIGAGGKRITAVGRQREEIVKDVYATAEKEILMLQMRYFQMGSRIDGEAITLRQLFSGDLLPQAIQQDATNFSLDTMEVDLTEGAERLSLHINVAEFKSRATQESRVGAKDISVLAILLEYYQRILSRLDTDPDSESLIPEVLQRIIGLCAGHDKSQVLRELSENAGRVLQEANLENRESGPGVMGQNFAVFQSYKAGQDITAAEAEASADQFSDYPVITGDEAKSMAEQNPYNRGEEYDTLYGTAGEKGMAYGYIRTGNSFEINRYMRNEISEDFAYENHATIGMLDQAAKANRLPHKARFYRMLKADYLQHALGLDDFVDKMTKGFAQGTVQAVNRMAGKVVTDSGFMCVGYQVDGVFSNYPVMLTLLCDEGMPLMATSNFEEGEFILPRNTSYMIIGARKREGGDKKRPKERTFIRTGGNGAREEGFFRGLEIICKVLNPEAIQNPAEAQSPQSMGRFKEKQISYVGKRGRHGDGVHRKAYLEMSRRDLETLTDEEKIAMDEYTNDSGAINRRLRSGQDQADAVQDNIHHIKEAMRKHPLPTDITTYRGVDDGMLTYLMGVSPDITQEDKNRYVNQNGEINHEEMAKGGYKIFEGIVFRDPAFVSTTTNRYFAKRWANGLVHKAAAARMRQDADEMEGSAVKKWMLGEKAKSTKKKISDVTGSHMMNMHIRRGTRALFSDAMFTRTNRPRGQDELTLDSGGTYRITAVRMDTMGQYIFDVEVL